MGPVQLFSNFYETNWTLITAGKIYVRHEEALGMGDKRKFRTLPLGFKHAASFPSVGDDVRPVFSMLLFLLRKFGGLPLPCLLHKGLTPCLSIQDPPQCIPIHLPIIVFHCSVCKSSVSARQSLSTFPTTAFPASLPPPGLPQDVPLLSSHQSQPAWKTADLSQTDQLITKGASLKTDSQMPSWMPVESRAPEGGRWTLFIG